MALKHMDTGCAEQFQELPAMDERPLDDWLGNQGLAQAQVTFHEASAYFSAEEWNLLQEWQKELCKNVMKEIHQALLSLGPLIATTVCSARAKEKGAMSPMDNQYYSKSETTTDHNALLKIDNQKPPHLISHQDVGDREGNDCLRADPCPTGLPFFNTDVLLSEKEEPVPVFIDHLGVEIGESNMDPISGHNVISLHIKDENDTDCMNYQECMGMEVPTSPPASIHSRRMTNENGGRVCNSISHPRRPRFTDDELTALAEGTVRYPADKAQIHTGHTWVPPRHPATAAGSEKPELHGVRDWGRGNIRNAGNESMTRKETDGISIKPAEVTPLFNAFSGTIETGFLKNSNKETHSGIHNWPDNDQDLKEEKPSQCNSGFGNPVHFSLNQWSPNKEILEKSNESEITTVSQNPKDSANAQKNQRSIISTEVDKNYSLMGQHKRKGKKNSRERPYACNECEKSFFWKSHLLKHHIIHSGEKPYACTFCRNRFKRKDYLSEHIRMHTGVRPYTCTKCDKSFNRKSHLNDHQRKRKC